MVNMKEQILAEIKRIASTGKVPGWRAFAKETGFREYDWRGVHWARWGDALKEAGLEPKEPLIYSLVGVALI